MERWGWISSTKEVAEFERITMTDAYKLKIVHYLNSLAYLKDFNKYKEAQYKQWELRHKQK